MVARDTAVWSRVGRGTSMPMRYDPELTSCISAEVSIPFLGCGQKVLIAILK